MSSNDNFPPKTPTKEKTISSYVNNKMIVITSWAVSLFGVYKMKSADLSPVRRGDSEVNIFFYKDSQIGKFKVNFIGKSARIAVVGFANFYGLPLPQEKSFPFEIRSNPLIDPIDDSFSVLPDLVLTFSWPEIFNPLPRKVKKLVKTFSEALDRK